MIVTWLNEDTQKASGVPPEKAILITDVRFVIAGDDSWQTVVYVEVEK